MEETVLQEVTLSLRIIFTAQSNPTSPNKVSSIIPTQIIAPFLLAGALILSELSDKF